MSCFWSEFLNEADHFGQILEETAQLPYHWRNQVLSERPRRNFLSAFLCTLHDDPVYRTFLRDFPLGPGVSCRSLAAGTLWWGPIAVTGVFHGILQLDICRQQITVWTLSVELFRICSNYNSNFKLSVNRGNSVSESNSNLT